MERLPAYTFIEIMWTNWDGRPFAPNQRGVLPLALGVS